MEDAGSRREIKGEGRGEEKKKKKKKKGLFLWRKVS